MSGARRATVTIRVIALGILGTFYSIHVHQIKQKRPLNQLPLTETAF
jgi:hypothetical protein